VEVNGQLHAPASLPPGKERVSETNGIMLMKSKGLRLSIFVAKHEKGENIYYTWPENLRGRGYLVDVGADLRIILKIFLENMVYCCGLVIVNLGQDKVAAPC
jgi:hypothetical protein